MAKKGITVRLGRGKTLPKKTKRKPRKDWEYHQEKVSAAFWELATIPGKLKMPTIQEVCDKTGLSRKSVERHLEVMDVKAHMQKLRMAEDKMLIVFMNKVAKSSNDKMWDLYWSLTNPNFIRNKSTSVKVQTESPGTPQQTTKITVLTPGDAD